MAKVCAVTGGRPSRGYKYAIRGIAKKKKGIGLKTTGKTKRRFDLNIMNRRVWDREKGCWVRLKVTARGLRNIDRLGLAAALR